MWPMKAWFITDTHHWLLSMYHTTLNKVDLKYCQTTLSNFSISLYSTLATCLLVVLFRLPGKFGTWKCDLNMMLSYNQVFFWSQNVNVNETQLKSPAGRWSWSVGRQRGRRQRGGGWQCSARWWATASFGPEIFWGLLWCALIIMWWDCVWSWCKGIWPRIYDFCLPMVGAHGQQEVKARQKRTEGELRQEWGWERGLMRVSFWSVWKFGFQARTNFNVKICDKFQGRRQNKKWGRRGTDEDRILVSSPSKNDWSTNHQWLVHPPSAHWR